MLFPMPDGVSDHAATLHEPVSIAVHGLLRAPVRDGDPVLVVGAAIIGLATVAAIRALFPKSPVTVLARHERQAEAARAVGADAVVRAADDGSPLWWKEAAFVGAARHSTVPGLDGAPTAHSIARALEILAAGYLPSDAVITHEFPLEAHRDAIGTARDRRAGAIKVVFRPAH